MTESGAPIFVTLVLNLLAIFAGYAILAGIFVGFVRWLDRRAATDKFADEFIPENADVVAVEDTMPDVRSRLLELRDAR